ncbi:MAG: Rieske (2Fe-2S) protein [Chloroflexota bacterium]
MTKHIVGTVDEIPPGGRKIVEINGRSIGIFNVNGEFFALRNYCPHEGAELCTGTVTGLRLSDKPGEYSWDRAGEIVRCPWHGWEFDIKTGRSWFDPKGVRVRPFPIQIESDVSGYQPGPYTVETYPTEIDQAYIVIDLSPIRRS